MLAYGCTRLEIGVQSVYEDVARDTNRYVFFRYMSIQLRSFDGILFNFLSIEVILLKQ